MELSHLKVFQAVAQTGSVSGAAHGLNCVQSNVTARIKGLETELGVKLFYRRPKGMLTTPAGQILLDYARKMIHLEKEAKHALVETDRVQGPLLLGAFESVAAHRLPAFLARYHRLYPEVDLSLATGTSPHLNQKVLNYELDGAFVTEAYQVKHMTWTKAFTEELVLIYPPGEPSPDKAAQKGVLVFPKPCAYRERLEQWFQEQNLGLHKKVELGSADGMISCVAAGMGVSLLPLSLVQAASDQGTVCIHTIGTHLESVPIMFVKREDTLISKPLAAFLDLLDDPDLSGK